jgi:hypothetical protein
VSSSSVGCEAVVPLVPLMPFVFISTPLVPLGSPVVACTGAGADTGSAVGSGTAGADSVTDCMGAAGALASSARAVGLVMIFWPLASGETFSTATTSEGASCRAAGAVSSVTGA